VPEGVRLRHPEDDGRWEGRKDKDVPADGEGVQEHEAHRLNGRPIPVPKAWGRADTKGRRARSGMGPSGSGLIDGAGVGIRL